MQNAEGKREKKKLQRAEGAGRLLLTMGQNRSHGKDKAGLVLLKETKLFFFLTNMGFTHLALKGWKPFEAHFSSRMSEFFLHRCLVFCSICICKYGCVCKYVIVRMHASWAQLGLNGNV